MSLTIPTAEPEELLGVCRQLETHLPGWQVDGVLAFGSTARDEAVPSSDIDLWFIGHGPDQLYLDEQWRQGRFAATIDAFLGDWSHLPVTPIETWKEVQPSIALADSWRFGCPIADTRWFLWQLAEEAEWQTFLFLATGQVVCDPRGFLASLLDLMWAQRPFHTHPGHGIVRTLRSLCEAEKTRLLCDLTRLTGTVVDGATTDHTIWLWPAVGCIRDSIVLLTLIQLGRPIFRRREVLRFIEAHFLAHLQVARDIYECKLSERWRQDIRALVEQPDSELADVLRMRTEAVLDFWHAVMHEADKTVLRGKSLVPFAEPGWQAQNHEVYRGHFEEYARIQKKSP